MQIFRFILLASEKRLMALKQGLQSTAVIRTTAAVMSAIPILCCGAVPAQPVHEHPSFEVASVKEVVVDDPESDFVPRRSGDRIRMHNADLWKIIAWAYHLTNAEYQLVALAPNKKLLLDDYDIQALAPGSPKDDDLRMMFQTLLEDRFGLRAHWEKKEMEAYHLVVGKGGPKLAAAPSRAVKPGIGFGGGSSWVEFHEDGQHLVGKSASMEEMVVVLTRKMSKPVRDRTGIAGMYDFDVAFSSGVDGSEKPVLATALRDLGLHLEKSKGMFEVLIVDHIQKPTSN
jgi:uncharacterized protein (TIGR03435 family)